jgi:hypothetical protein
MKSRRTFIQISTAAAGGLAFCAAGSDDPYRMTAYCAQNCEQCEWYRFKQCPTCKVLRYGACETRKCAEAKGVPTCAHCADLDSCKKLRPHHRSMAHALRRQIAAAKASC